MTGRAECSLNEEGCPRRASLFGYKNIGEEKRMTRRELREEIFKLLFMVEFYSKRGNGGAGEILL